MVSSKKCKYVLTVAIPFRGNFGYLTKSLTSVVTDVKQHKLQEVVEVLVSCNVSDSRILLSLGELLRKDFTEVREINHKTELSYDSHLREIMKKAKGRFVKILADDDWISPGYLPKLIQTITQQPESLAIVTNFKLWSEDAHSVKKLRWFSSEETTTFVESMSKKSLLTALQGAYGQVSSLTFNKEITCCTRDLMVETDHIQVFWFLSAIARNRASYDPANFVNVREGSPNFVSDMAHRITTPLRALAAIDAVEDLDLTVKRMLMKKQVRYLIYILTSLHKVSMIEHAKIRRDFTKSFRLYPRFMLIPFLITLIPYPFLAFVTRLFGGSRIGTFLVGRLS